MDDQNDLPKPELDLPLPEKELISDEENSDQPIINPSSQHDASKAGGSENPLKESRHLIRAFLLGFLFVVILVSLGGIYFLGINKSNNINSMEIISKTPSPTLNPITNWETYEGELLSFKYPEEFEIHINESHVSGTDDKYVTKKNHIELNALSTGIIPSIIISYNPTTLNLPNFLNRSSTCSEINSKTMKQVKIDDVNAGYVKNVNCGQNGTTDFYVIKNGTGYKIEFHGNFKDDLIFQMIKTFKFTTPSSILTIIPTKSTQIPTISPTSNPTINDKLTIEDIEPVYIPQNYSSLGKNKLIVNGAKFDNGAVVTIEGPYELDTGEISNGETYTQYKLLNANISNNKIEGTIPEGLPNGYFRVVVKNSDGASASTGLSLLRGGDPNEK